MTLTQNQLGGGKKCSFECRGFENTRMDQAEAIERWCDAIEICRQERPDKLGLVCGLQRRMDRTGIDSYNKRRE